MHSLSEMEEGEMPREIIHDDRPLPGGDGEQSIPFAVSVGWGRDSEGVQIATIDLRVEDVHSPEHGWFVDLDRYRINQLIRVLRRARDQAFGRDE
jgi:hypothetical protein